MLSALGILGLAASLILATVFAAAGIAKLADLPGTRIAIREFGAPQSFVRPLALGLPFAELTVVALLVYGPTRIIGAAGALALLAVFSAAIAASLLRGRAPDCHCFGQLHSAPTSWKTLARNGVLAGLVIVPLGAGIVGETPSAFARVTHVGAVEGLAIATGVVAVALLTGGGLAFLSLMRSYGSVLLRLEGLERRLTAAGIDVEEHEELPELGLEPGTRAPAFVTTDTAGASVSLDDLLAPGLPLLLVFTSSSCGPCSALLPAIAGWQSEHADRLTFAVAHGSDRDTGRAAAEEHGLDPLLVDRELKVFEAYEASSTPNAVLVSPDGRVASWMAQGEDRIRDLLAHALDEPDEVEGLAVGSPAPEIELQALDGGTISLETIAGRETVVLFWNPGCGFCSSMRDEVLAWEQQAPQTAPQLLVVSSGDADSTRAEGFASLVALDPAFEAGTAFGAGGTPMAVLIDREGNIGSPLAAGAEAVFALAGARDAHAPSSSSEWRAAAIVT